MIKKVLIYFSMLLAIGLLSACSSDNDSDLVNSDIVNPEFIQSGEQVTMYKDGYGEVKAVYEPISYQKAPEWMKQMIDEKEKWGYYTLYIFKGENNNGETIYAYQSLSLSVPFSILSESGKPVNIGDVSYLEFLSQAKDWKLIYCFSNVTWD